MRRARADFVRGFWIATGLGLALCVALAVALGRSVTSAAPPKPPLPLPGHAYVSAYTRGHTDHYLFRFGLFDFGRRIGDADVLLLGSSHIELGISAAQLARELTARAGRPITAFNLGLGFGEGLGFAREIIAANQVRDRTAIIDAFAVVGDQVSEFGALVQRANVIAAYVQVGNIWADFLRDWLLDGTFARLRLNGVKLARERFLADVIVRDWSSGDVVDLWYGWAGPMYQSQPPGGVRPLPPGELAGGLPDAGVFLAPGAIAALRQRDIRPILTLVPYQGYRLAAAERLAQRERLPFVAIDPAELEFWDTNHLTARGRQLATSRLARALPLAALASAR